MVKIFSDLDDVKEICNEILKSGVAGISGGRLAVRSKMKDIRGYIEKNGYTNIVALSTYDHSDTELGYIYDEKQYNSKEACELVIKSYEK